MDEISKKERLAAAQRKYRNKPDSRAKYNEWQRKTKREREKNLKPITVTSKVCSKCKEEKPANQFGRNVLMLSGLHSSCKKCQSKAAALWIKNNPVQRNKRRSEHYHENIEAGRLKGRERYKKNPDQSRGYRFKAEFGITIEQYDRILKEQNGSCAICKISASECRKRLAIDHCHTTGKVRGLLCENCNNGLGRFKDRIELFEQSIEYLKKFKE